MNTERSPGSHEDFADDPERIEDEVLVSMARGGNEAAMTALFLRHRESAGRFASSLGLGADAHDAVSQAFAQILALLSRGKGPENAFRAYLFTTIRHEASRRARSRQRVVLTNDMADLDSSPGFDDRGLDSFELDVVRSAYQSLPHRWRVVLWQIDVEGHSAREIAEAHNMSSNAVSALAYRARTGLRQSYLEHHPEGDSSAARARRSRRTARTA